jgi:EAL domain-containing protein (putative c-di-GMP-specific phosphodiesterase class I)
VCTQTGEVLHHEWLVRFDSENGLESILRPAEISGAITSLDLSMLQKAIDCLNASPERHGIALNISGASFDNPDFEKAFFQELSRLQAPTHKLLFELTETWNLRDLKPAQKVLQHLRDHGHSVCLDDVGAGVASLRYLRAFPANWLKIDAGFLNDAHENSRAHAVLEAVLSLRDTLDVRFIAEGIETDVLKDFAMNLHIDALQGYLLGQPEPEPH